MFLRTTVMRCRVPMRWARLGSELAGERSAARGAAMVVWLSFCGLCSATCVLPEVSESSNEQRAEDSGMHSAVSSASAKEDVERVSCDEGSSRCSADFQGTETCVQGSWTRSDCATDTVCSAVDEQAAGGCVSLEPACAGHGGAWVCTPQGVLILCTHQEIARESHECASASACHAPAGYCDDRVDSVLPVQPQAGAPPAGSAGSAAMESAACQEGEVRCSDISAGRELCRDGKWESSPCEPNYACVMHAGQPDATCVRRSRECIGYAGKYNCDSEGYLIECTRYETLRNRILCRDVRLCNAEAGRCELCEEGQQRCSQRQDGTQYVERCGFDVGAQLSWDHLTDCGAQQTCVVEADRASCAD